MRQTIFDYARELGDHVGRAWSASDGGLAAFPEVALAAIGLFAPEQVIGLDSITDDVAAVQDCLPRQRAGGRTFGQPPLTLYNDPGKRFFVEVYLWSSTDMTIHDHPFTGAFTVLNGECANEVFTFERRSGSTDLQFGELSRSEVDTMLAGDARPVTNGATFIHRNQHLTRPTMTFIIRTLWDGGVGRIYEESGMALDPTVSPVEYKQLEFLEGLLRLPDSVAAWPYAKQLFENANSPAACYRIGKVYLQGSGDWNRLEEILAIVPPLLDIDQAGLANVYDLHRQQHLSRAPAR